jgi:hypothetical protein
VRRPAQNLNSGLPVASGRWVNPADRGYRIRGRPIRIKRISSIPAAEVLPPATSGKPFNGRMRTLLYEIYLAKIELFA